MKKFFTYRDYEVLDENNNICAIATSKWALMDMEQGKMSRITEEVINRYHPEEKSVFSEKNLDKIEIPTEFTSSIKYKVIRKDIDLNQHMHNLYYLDLAYEALPKEVYETRPFDHVRITYKKEIKIDDVINCKYANKNGKHIIVIESEDAKIVHAVVELL